jgi:soluble lytic murein transglycosylase-like protein
MEARRLTSSLAVLLLASLSCNIVPADGPAGRGVPTGFEESEALRFARVSEAKHPGVVAFLAGLPTGLDEDGREALAHAVIQESVRSGLEVELVLGVILVESSGNTRAVSKAGAIGLMQLRPFTAEAVAAEIGLPWTGPTLLFDPVANVRLGVAYLSQLIERYGDVATALAAYNWGPTHIAARLRRGEPLPAEYVSRVLVAADASALRTQLGS